MQNDGRVYLLDQRYQLLERIGRTKNDELYTARDAKLGRTVLVRLLPEHTQSEIDLTTWLPRFAKLSHQHVATLLDFNLAHDPPYIILDHASRYLVDHEQSIRDILANASELAQALAHLHDAGLAHGSLGHDTVLLRKTGVLLTDITWGDSAEPTDDIHALGTLLYLILTQQLPDPTLTPPSYLNLQGGIPGQLDSLILRMLAPDPANRPNAATVVYQLRRINAYLESRQDGTTLETAEPALKRRVVVMRDGIVLDIVPIETETFVIGSGRHNAVALEAGGVADEQVRVQISESGWELYDLLDGYATMLDSHWLMPETPELWGTEEVLSVGVYELKREDVILEQAEQNLSLNLTQIASGSSIDALDGYTRLIGEAGSGIGAISQSTVAQLTRIEAALSPTEITLNPGETQAITIALKNPTPYVLQLLLDVTPLPSSWYHLSQRVVDLMPNMEKTLLLLLHPPNAPETTAGTYDLNLLALGQEQTKPIELANAQLTILPFSQTVCHLRPTILVNAGQTRFAIHNRGNTIKRYTITGRDIENGLRFSGVPATVMCRPNEQQTVAVNLKTPQRPLLSRTRSVQFTLSATDESGDAQHHSGQMQIRPRLPLWIIPLVSFLLIFSCLLSVNLINRRSTQLVRATVTADAATASARIGLELTRSANQLSTAIAPPTVVYPSVTPLPTVTPSDNFTVTIQPTDTPLPTLTPLPVATSTQPPTPTVQPSPTASPTATATATPTAEPSATTTLTATTTATLEPTATVTATAEPTATATLSTTLTVTPTLTVTLTTTTPTPTATVGTPAPVLVTPTP